MAKTKQKKKSVAEQAEELIDAMSHDELKSFVRDNCRNDKRFRQMFVSENNYLLDSESKEIYAAQLQTLIEEHSNMHGFTDYREVECIGRDIREMTNEALYAANHNDFLKSMYISSAIIEEMTIAMDHADDSYGLISYNIRESITTLDMLTEAELDDNEHDELFECLLDLFDGGSLKGWDWYLTPIELAIKILRTDKEKERIKTAIETIEPNEDYGDSDYKKAQELMFEFIKKAGNSNDATLYIENNISNPQFRAELIKRAIKEKDYQKAEKLAYDGIAQAGNSPFHQADEWHRYLLTIYQKTGNDEKTIQLARYFITHSYMQYDDFNCYYKLLKTLIPKDQWQDCFTGIIYNIKKAYSFIDYERISQLYIWEESWDDLLALLSKESSFKRIADAEKYLSKSYSAELANLYRQYIHTYLKDNKGRKYYKTVCRYLRHMIKLGECSMATELILELKTTYRTRRALIEELDNV